MQNTMEWIADPAYDILRSERKTLESFFAPRAVAVIGASETPGSVGRTLLRNLIHTSFGGTVYPVNPKRHSVMGIKAYPNLAAIPDTVDLAVIATPASTVPNLVRECGIAGVKSAIIVSAGFKEIGAPGIALEKEILATAREYGLRIIGPNCLGLMNPHSGLNATFASAIARPGNVGFISQSGALCTSILDWSFRENVGFSAFISIGSMLDVGWGDLIYYLGDDPHTHSIVIYMESIGDARSFLSAAREVALTKPIIAIKAGRTEAAAKASASHTGAMTGSDDVLNAAFRRCGVLRVTRISELFNMAEVLAKQPRPQGPHLTIITNAGGPGVLATDMLVSTGGELADLSEETVTKLNEVLPPFWSHSNPVDILGDATPERYLKTVDTVLQDPKSDGALVILTPQAMTEPTQIAEELRDFIQGNQLHGKLSKPILASWMGGEEVSKGEQILNTAKIPTYAYPDSAVRVFNYMWQSSYSLQALYETPSLAEDWDGSPPDRKLVRGIVEQARAEGRTLLTEVESKQLLGAYHLPVVPTVVATNTEEAVKCAEEIGFPVVLKLWSATITHKTDVGGVQLNLGDVEAVRRAFNSILENVTYRSGAEHFQGVTVQPMVSLKDSYELIVGSSIDPQFGPILLFGSGGQLVEVFRDRAIALPPLNTTLARRMMEQTQIFKALKGVRGRAPVDIDALAKLLVKFSQLVVEQPWIKDIEINPLLVSANPDAKGSPFLALDARVILHDPSLTVDDLPKLAIRPYPIQYVGTWTMEGGAMVTIRPIRPEDEPLSVKFHHTLSEESVYFRYFHPMKLSQRTAHDRLMRLCFIDYDREMALVADYKNPETKEHEILAIGRLSKLHGVNEAEFSLMVSDRYQRRGLGTEILRRLLAIAEDEKIGVVSAQILADNTAMQRVCEKVGFTLQRSARLVVAKIELK